MKTRYSAEFRLEVVQYQLKGHSKVEAARKFGINPSSAERWLVLYNQNGKDSLNRTTCYAEFDLNFKLKVVQSVINDGLSLREAEKTYNLRTKAVITNWLRQYEKDGINGLQPKKGKHRLLKQPKQIDPEQARIDKSKTQDELLEEIAYLRAEVDLLKKRRALRLESKAVAQKRLLKSSQN